MVNYNNGKIYKIMPLVDYDEGDIYIGSTTKQYLSQRMDSHRYRYKNYKLGLCGPNKLIDKCFNGHTGVPTSCLLFDKYGVDNCDIILLETVYANTKDELMSREKHYIQSLKCINKRVPCRYGTLDRKDYCKNYNKEYAQINRKRLNEKRMEYYNKNKEIYNSIRREKYNKINYPIFCEICNCSITSACLQEHLKTKKHFKNLTLTEYEYFYEDGTPCTEDEYNLYK